MISLQQLIQEIAPVECIGKTDKLLSSITFDTRKIINDGDEAVVAYFAQKGINVDGHQFINQAIEKGAGVIICEVLPIDLNKTVTYLRVSDAAYALAIAASAFYHHPSKKLKLIGVTGTNGKTTIVTLLHKLFGKLGFKTGLLSTVENRIDTESFPSTHTTPDAVSLNALLSRMVDAGCEYCFMEVSSHSIVQHRIAGLYFTGGIFTNITHDHLDYHKTFTNYIAAKKAFFDQLPSSAFALTNKDDKNGLVMTQNSKARTYTYSLNTLADFKAKILDNSFEGLHLDVNHREAFFQLCGKFNAYNLLAIYGTAVLVGAGEEDVLIALSSLESAAGRFQIIRNEVGNIAIVDYAHTPDALQNVLTTIKDIIQNSVEVLTVVGAGGDRDKSKRPEMAKIACRYSDKVIFTSDNPRTENPQQILQDMAEGIPPDKKHKTLTIENREEAIKTACMLLSKGVLLVAGKGHETYQEINGVKQDFDDKKIILKYFLTQK
jgi:UDP-N-acetylmuramoyl-L-alanyl-D-glutamate--2,6-diaminopimelate ligase